MNHNHKNRISRVGRNVSGIAAVSVLFAACVQSPPPTDQSNQQVAQADQQAGSVPQEQAASSNLALNRAATGSPICKPGEEVEKAFNGSNTSWTHDKFCTLETPAWLQVDLGGEHEVSRVVIRHAGVAGEDAAMNTRAFRVSTSLDGKAWQTVSDVHDNTGNVSDLAIAAHKARHVRLDVTKPSQKADDPATRIYEVEVY